ncbi:MAG TPA: UbiA family prenyltransferase [Hanamia sp.]|nr:UbiA family prenyltransferase [Hanamia sp.]
MNNHGFDENIPLVVDLDGTLIKTDLLHEGVIMLLRKNLLYIFPCLLWMLKGKVYFKNRIFNKVHLHYELLPNNEELLNFLQTESSSGRKIILATASLMSNAQEISKVYPIFDEVYGTEKINLKGANKLKILIDEFGESNFDYIGNSHSDLKIIASSRYSYLVNPSKSLERKTRKISELKYVWKVGKIHLKDYVKAIRGYQWLKNLLIFVPLFTSHSFYSPDLIFQAIAAFFAFSFTASAGYVINDLLDLNSDRSHPRKRFRPFASGKLSISSGIILALVILTVGLTIASQLNVWFFTILLGYFLVSISYSLFLKRIALYDVFILAFFYSTRIIAGGQATQIPISFWLITFSTFMFLSLAFVKRCSELMKTDGKNGLHERGREYTKEDLNLLQIMGIVSGFLSVVVFSLYINSPEVRILYSRPKILWTVGFLLLFWICRIWMITNRGKMTDDPIVFTIKDAGSYLIFLIIALTLFLSI